MERFTIIDYIERMNVQDRPTKTPYKWTEIDSGEIASGEYMKTKQSFLRIVTAIIQEQGLDQKSRKREFVDQRKFLMYQINKSGGFNYSQIGRMFNRDHATVLHCLKSYDHERHIDEFKSNVNHLSQFFNQFQSLKFNKYDSM